MSRQLLQQQQGYASSAPPTPNSLAGSRSARSVTGESHPAEAMKLLRLSRNPKRMRELPSEVAEMISSESGRRQALQLLVQQCGSKVGDLREYIVQQKRSRIFESNKKKRRTDEEAA